MEEEVKNLKPGKPEKKLKAAVPSKDEIRKHISKRLPLTRFDIPEDLKDPDYEYCHFALAVHGKPETELVDKLKDWGWEACTEEDFPDLGLRFGDVVKMKRHKNYSSVMKEKEMELFMEKVSYPMSFIKRDSIKGKENQNIWNLINLQSDKIDIKKEYGGWDD